MKKAYLIVPLAALLAFGALYWNFERGYARREQAARQQARLEKEAKLKAEVEARAKSIEDALRLQAERRKAREEREARENAEKETRQFALDARDKAFRDQEQLSRQIERLKKDIIAEQAAIAEIAAAHKTSVEEQTFLKEYIGKAEENIRTLETLLNAIAAAESIGVLTGGT
ncbi:hypothetical protein Ga0100231_022975 [Opitutaceae bacterium TAV4]|nr:hypothetical protein Ga0100231_022975 [Opitutaceae bacterium TAV4]RRK00710.1 hypothetical protein Ga0100230_023230 [Opitutaceae bacterium TAV3]